MHLIGHGYFDNQLFLTFVRHVVKIYFLFGTAQLGLLQVQYRSRQEIRDLCLEYLLFMGLLSQCELPPKELELLHMVAVVHME